jgi:hypothetical protein
MWLARLRNVVGKLEGKSEGGRKEGWRLTWQQSHSAGVLGVSFTCVVLRSGILA